MRSPILNREFAHPADGWYQIEVPGVHLNANAAIVSVIDAKAVDSMVDRFNEEADDYKGKTGRDFPGMCVDIEHFKMDPEKETRAYGWLLELKNCNGAPYGRINWTGTGRPAVDGGDYRFFSTEYNLADCEVLNDANPKRVRPLRLAGLTLTNQPNHSGGAPITNRAGEKAGDDDALKPGPESFPTPDLDKWFMAVQSVQKSAQTHGKIGLDWNTAAAMAKKQFPELYTAAFSGGEANAASGRTSADMAGAQVARLANRIAREGKVSVHRAYELVRAEFPAVYNRSSGSPSPAPRRETSAVPDGQLQDKAAQLIARLASEEQKASRMPYGHAFIAVMNREATLAKLANGEITPADAFAEDATIRNRLM